MRFSSIGAVAILSFSAAVSQAGNLPQVGQVFIDDRGPGVMTVSDNCGGNCFSNLSVIDSNHITFDWNVSLGSNATQTVFWDGFNEAELTHLVVLSLTLGSPVVNVSAWSSGGSYDILGMALGYLNNLGTGQYLGEAANNGQFNLVAPYHDYSPGHNNAIIDELYLAADTPEPGTLCLIGASLVALGLLRRRRAA